MPELDLDVLAAKRARLRETYLRDSAERVPTTARGVHHVAVLCTDVEQTITFYQDLLEFPLTALFENRDYRGSTHFFFDIGNGNSLAFFDFPGLDVGAYREVLGGLDTGTHVLARAGLLNGYRATLHWENLPAFTEEFPDIETSAELFEIDRKRVTCSGGTAAIDMMLHVIWTEHGQALAMGVSEQLLHDRIRSPGDHQRMALGLRLGVRHPKLLTIVEAMEQAVEEPLSLDRLAGLGGISRRQLERLFRAHLGDTPTGYYLKLRLRRARHLLEQTEMSVLQVGTACGFASAPYFSRAYRGLFGRPPREDRRFAWSRRAPARR